jgi:ribonuclease HI
MFLIDAYTDGGVKNNGGEGRMGMGVVLIGPRTIELQKAIDTENATNNRAELHAIIMALEGIKPSCRPQTRMRIITDSQWCIHAIDGSWDVTKNLDLIAEARALIEQYRSVEFQYVRGHNGDPNNERANELAQRQAGTWKGK